MIFVQRENIDGAIQRLKVSLIKEGVGRALERKKYHRSPSEMRKWKNQKAQERRRQVEKRAKERYVERGRELRKMRLQKERNG